MPLKYDNYLISENQIADIYGWLISPHTYKHVGAHGRIQLLIKAIRSHKKSELKIYIFLEELKNYTQMHLKYSLED